MQHLLGDAGEVGGDMNLFAARIRRRWLVVFWCVISGVFICTHYQYDFTLSKSVRFFLTKSNLKLKFSFKRV